MEFRLVYKGSLPAESRAGGRADEKHAIRKEFHKQLAELWKQHPRLKWWQDKRIFPGSPHLETGQGGWYSVPPGASAENSIIEYLAKQHERCGYRFVPLIRNDGGAVCSLEILFLRRDNPGSIIRSGGDIDNRIKMLFDGLKTPTHCGELGNYSKPGDGEDPFFTLLEDDSLVTDVSVTTDRLLLPMVSGEREHDVELVILVKTRVLDSTRFLHQIHL